MEVDNLKIQKYENATVLPWKIDPKGSTGLGGVLNDEGAFIEASYCHGGRFEHGGIYDFNSDLLQQSDDKVIYFGYFLPHWGHFLIDCLGRMWPFTEKSEELKEYKIVFISQVDRFYSNCYDFFDALGISRDRFVYIKYPTIFREVLIPEIDYTPEPGRTFSPQYLQVYDMVVRNILLKHSLNEVTDKFGDISKVYFTRSSFRGALSREVGLDIIDKVFHNGGFNIISPEKLSLIEQVLIWNNANHIACINGTIPLNVIFYNPSLNTTCINDCDVRVRAGINTGSPGG